MIHAHTILERLRINDTQLPNYMTPGPLFDQLMSVNKSTIEALVVAGKFDLGCYSNQDAEALCETGEALINEGLGVLPFPRSYFELNMGDTARRGVLLVPASDLQGMFEDPEKGILSSVKVVAVTFSAQTGVNCHTTWGTEIICLAMRADLSYVGPFLLSSCSAKGVTPELSDMQDVAHHLHDIVCVSLALLGTNACEVVHERAPTRLNKARVKKGKIPLFSHHIVKVGGVSSNGGIVGLGGTHASPRKHWRRGHVRVLHRGTPEEKKITIPAMLIGGRGFVSKDYEVVQ